MKLLRDQWIGVLALFLVVTGGTAWAVVNNSIGSSELKRGAVKKSDVARNAITSPKVADGRLRAEDFAEGQLPAGPQGPPGATNITIRQADSPPGWAVGSQESATASCNQGERATGGGFETFFHDDYNDLKPVRFRVTDTSYDALIVANVVDADAFLRTYVYCASP